MRRERLRNISTSPNRVIRNSSFSFKVFILFIHTDTISDKPKRTRSLSKDFPKSFSYSPPSASSELLQAPKMERSIIAP